MQTRTNVIAAILLSALVVAPSVSRAEIVEAIIDSSDTVIGSISFPGVTGSSAAGVDLSLAGFTQANITSVSWTLNSSTYAVDALDLSAIKGDLTCSMNCSNSSLSLSETSYSVANRSCSANSCSQLPGYPNSISFRLTAVPEPSTWAMMLAGFAGLGFAGYRASRKAVA